MTAHGDVDYTTHGRVAVVTIDRPEARNTVTYPVLDALLDAFARADADEDVRAVVVTGTGEFFSAGTDLSAGAGGTTPTRRVSNRCAAAPATWVASWRCGSSARASR